MFFWLHVVCHWGSGQQPDDTFPPCVANILGNWNEAINFYNLTGSTQVGQTSMTRPTRLSNLGEWLWRGQGRTDGWIWFVDICGWHPIPGSFQDPVITCSTTPWVPRHWCLTCPKARAMGEQLMGRPRDSEPIRSRTSRSPAELRWVQAQVPCAASYCGGGGLGALDAVAAAFSIAEISYSCMHVLGNHIYIDRYICILCIYIYISVCVWSYRCICCICINNDIYT